LQGDSLFLLSQAETLILKIQRVELRIYSTCGTVVSLERKKAEGRAQVVA